MRQFIKFNSTKYIEAQNDVLDDVMYELLTGKKETHWIWFVFPQLTALGHSVMSQYYGLDSLEDAIAYADNDVLCDRFMMFCDMILDLDISDPVEIFGELDALKVQSSMTLFLHVKKTHDICKSVLHKFYNDLTDSVTDTYVSLMEGV